METREERWGVSGEGMPSPASHQPSDESHPSEGELELMGTSWMLRLLPEHCQPGAAEPPQTPTPALEAAGALG